MTVPRSEPIALHVYAELETITGYWVIDIPSAHTYGARHKGTLREAVAEALGVPALDGYRLHAHDFSGDGELDYSD